MGVYDVVTQQFNEANQYAVEAWEIARQGLQDLISTTTDIGEIDPSAIDFSFTPISDATFTSITPPNEPDYGQITLSDPVLENLSSIPTISVNVPSNPYSPISVEIPDKPSLTFPDDPGEAPEILIPDTPPLSITIPTRPSIQTSFTMPVAPEYILPTFNEQKPVFDIGEFDAAFDWSEPPTYTSQLLELVKAKISNTLINGGTGIGDEAEQAIWDNAVARQDEQDEKLFNEALEFFASRGWNLPIGALNAKLTEARIESRRSLEKLNNDILIQQSNLAYQNMKDSIAAAQAIESMLLNYANAIAQRSLEAATASIQASVSIYNAKLASFSAKLELYKTAASVYGILVQAQEGIINLYNAQLAGVKLQQELELAKLEVYKQDLAAVSLLVDVWKSQLQGNGLILEGEKTKLEAYKIKVDAFIAKFEEAKTKSSIYNSELQGEAIKAQINSENTKAYLADVEAAKTKASIAEINVNSVVAGNKNRIDAYAAAIDKYKADIQKYASFIDALTKRYAASGSVYENKVKSAIAQAQNQAATSEANLKLLLQKAELMLKQAEFNIQSAVEVNKVIVEGEKAISAVAAQMAAGALSSANASAHISGSTQVSYDETKSEPTYSYNHVYEG